MGESKTTALELGFNPQQEELEQDTENVGRSNTRYERYQLNIVPSHSGRRLLQQFRQGES